MDAMERTIAAGFATPYFITQPERAVACMEGPAALFCRRVLTLKDLAAWLGAFVYKTDGAPAGEQAGAERALKALREIIECGKPAEALPLPHPLLVLSEGLDRQSLAALLLVKLRGYRQTLALDASGGRFDVTETRDWLIHGATWAPEPVLSSRDGDVAGFGQVRGLRVVSGVKETVLSTEDDCERILARHPSLAQRGLLKHPACFLDATADGRSG
jgi:hypothetical protein